jgi:acyl transferase domain-containing protein/acyl carrier protein
MSSHERGVIAVTGLACRFPGAPNADAFWQLLIDGRESVGPMPPDRFDPAIFDDRTPGERGSIAVRRGGFLDDVDRFDAAFFGITPREAAVMDPQHRLLLETAWEAIEDAGLTAHQLAGSKTGVFVGLWTNDYERLVAPTHDEAAVDMFAATGTGRYAASGRISYAFDLRGPSVVVDTACSSALVAAHTACRSLQSGECEIALVGAANLILDPLISIAYSRSGLLGREGRCRFGDADAGGYVRSEGVGVLVLRRQSTAIAAGDRIRALLVGSATSNDGRSSGSLVAPGAASQAALFREACQVARIDPGTVDYIEAHGTGTRVGDPAELTAIANVFRRTTGPACLVGSVKTNIGHTESAAGMAGLIKTILSLQHGIVPASLHLRTPHPDVSLPPAGIQLCTEATQLARGVPAIAGVNAFGITGTNAHVVVEQASPQPAVSTEGTAPFLVPLSAHSDAALSARVSRWRENTWDGNDLARVACTAAIRRTHHARRRAIVARDFDELRAALSQPVAGGAPQDDDASGSVVFVFPGQGSQWLGMGRQLVASDAVARDALAACDAALAPYWKQSASDLIAGTAAPDLDDVAVVQPLLFAVQVMLARVWMSWGIRPAACIGHSMGEVAAAHVAGALSLDDAARVITVRSALLRRVRGLGAMALVEATEAEAARLIEIAAARLSVAAINDSRSVVVSGEPDAVDAIVDRLEAEGRFCRRVSVDVASHSPQMDDLVAPLLDGLCDLAPDPGAGLRASRSEGMRRFYPTAGNALGEATFDAAYWARNLRAPVRFASACRAALDDGHRTFLEISPHPILTHSVAEVAREAGIEVTIAGSLRRGEDDRRSMQVGAGTLFEAGHDLDWNALYPVPGPVVDLPAYPWQRERFWIDHRRHPAGGGASLPGRQSIGDVAVAAADVAGRTYWSRQIGLTTHPALRDHQVAGQPVVPAAFFVDLAAQLPGTSIDVASGMRATLHETLTLGGGDRELQAVIDAGSVQPLRVRFFSKPFGDVHGAWTLHCTINASDATAGTGDATPTDNDSQQLGVPISSGSEPYALLARRGLDYGPLFRRLTSVIASDDAAAELSVGVAPAPDETPWVSRVTLIDACLQAIVLSLPERDADTWLPVDVERLRILSWPDRGERVTCRVKSCLTPAGEDGDRFAADALLIGRDGRLLLAASGVVLKRAGRRPPWQRLLHAIVWRPLDGHHLVTRPKPAACTRIVFDDTAGIGLSLLPKADAATAVRLKAQTSGNPRQVLEALRCDRSRPIEILHAWNLDVPVPGTPEDSLRLRSLGLTSLLDAIRALAAHPAGGRVIVVTRGAQNVLGHENVAVAQTAVWGLASVVRAEYPMLPCVTLDLDPDARGVTESVRQTLDACRRSESLAIRGDRAFVARLDRAPSPGNVPRTRPWSGEPIRFAVGTPGDLDTLAAVPMERREPRGLEVEIEVTRTAINFSNVMSAFGIDLGDGAGSLGIECVGRVTRCGEQSRLAVDERVLGYAVDSLASHVVTDSRLVSRVPAQLSDEAAATIPVAFATAWHALVRLAQLQPDEHVLIHSAAGGVGLAAVQVARLVGADVLATAGTEEKRAYLRHLGIRHVFDSRTTGFARDVRVVTNGVGVDVVLNSLSGDAIDAGLSSLAPGGRFVELGKRDLLQNRQVGLGAFRANISYHVVDLHRLAGERPALVGTLIQEVMGLAAAGRISALPRQTFAAADATGAFKLMAAGKHIGKLIIDMTKTAALQVRRHPSSPDWATGAHLITGGFGALGLAVARWLTTRGARELALVGRRAPDAAAREQISALEAQGVSIRVAQADVADRGQLDRVVREIRSGGRPLRTVIHAAGILDDGLIDSLDDARLARVMAAKVDGAWHLHELTRGDQLDAFVLFSSVSAFLGSAGQGNYAAANAFLDGLAHHRRALGLPAVSVQWGPWAERGLAAADRTRGARLSALGLESLAEDESLALLEGLIDANAPVVAAMRFDAPRWRASAPGAQNTSLFDLLGDGTVRPAAAATPLTAAFAQAPTAAARRALLERLVRDGVARAVHLAPEQVALSASFKSLGLDSLMTLEFRRRLEAETGLMLTTTIVWNHPTVKALASYLGERLGEPTAPHSAVTSSNEADDEIAAVLAEIDALSDEEVRQLSLKAHAGREDGHV